MNFIIKEAEPQQISIIYTLLSECGREMFDKYQLKHWYPFMSLEEFINQTTLKKLYTVFKDDLLVATFNLSMHPRDYYFDELWKNPKDKAIYLGQLGISPNLQGNGIGKVCMLKVEDIASEMGCKAIRFDALEHHPWLKLFYINLGYSPVGIVRPKDWNLLCFEKVLNQ